MSIKIVSAERPVRDDATAWRKSVRNYLGDRWRQEDFDKGLWVECDACKAKPGSPALCAGCLANRNTIERLKALVAQ